MAVNNGGGNLGSKGRDTLIWFFIIGSITAVVFAFMGYVLPARIAMLVDLIFVLPVVLFNLKVKAARKSSRERGLNLLMTLPVSPVYASWLLSASKTKILAGYTRACELHVSSQCRYASKEFVSLMKSDLDLLKKQQGEILYLWETNVPVPGEFRQLIREMERRGQAVWERGRWPVPVPPLTVGHRMEKHIRRGALVWRT